jgi:hypothetical protein
MGTWKAEREMMELIKIDLRKISFEGGLWMELTQNRV